MYMVKFGPTVLNFGYDFFLLVPFFGTPCRSNSSLNFKNLVLERQIIGFALGRGGSGERLGLNILMWPLGPRGGRGGGCPGPRGAVNKISILHQCTAGKKYPAGYIVIFAFLLGYPSPTFWADV